MPVATVDPNDFIRVPLETAPADPSDPTDEDGYVMLRPLPYGMKLERRDNATKMLMRAKAPQKVKGRMKTSPNEEDAVMEFETANEWATAFDFAYCIGEHNLTDKNKVKLDFTKAMSLKQLNPRIGSEIERNINEINELEDEESLEDFLKRSHSSSEETPTLDEDSTERTSPIGTLQPAS